MSKFDIKNFVALIAFNDELRNIYFNSVEVYGIHSTWDVYHVLAGEEVVPAKEEEIMMQIYIEKIKGNKEIEQLYEVAVNDFRENVRKKIVGNS